MNFEIANILEYKASYLICSGNPALNMSGGVNAALREKYGNHLQNELHQYLKVRGIRNVDPGTAYLFKSKIGEYLGVTYCVGLDIWYESSMDIVNNCILNSMKQFGNIKTGKVAITAMATGYGKLKLKDFGRGMKMLNDKIDTSNLFVIVHDEDKLNEILVGYNT